VLLARHVRKADEIVDAGQAERAEEVEERIAAAEAKASGRRPPAHTYASGEQMEASDDVSASGDEAEQRSRFEGAGGAEGLEPADKAKA
jgi:hypothetical protein